MKTLASLYAIASALALVISPLSLEISASLVVAVGVLALMAGDYGRELGARA